MNKANKKGIQFFFPDSMDQISPYFDFRTEEHPSHRIRQRDDLYAHETLSRLPYDGILISKPVVDGMIDRSGNYTEDHKRRIYRDGAHKFFRADKKNSSLKIMGDCGAFTYADQSEPPYTIEEVINFYQGLGLDYGVSMDHIIFDYLSDAQIKKGAVVKDDWIFRQDLTVDIASKFYKTVKKNNCTFTPIAVAHGWDPTSYKNAVKELQKIGYTKIAFGGMVPLRTNDVLNVLQECSTIRKPNAQFHLLGLTRLQNISEFASLGVTSIDSTSPFRQAFMDEDDNYHTNKTHYTAIKVPQTSGNTALINRIKSGEVDQQEARTLENKCLDVLRKFDNGQRTLKHTIKVLRDYELIYAREGTDRRAKYERTLKDAPWKKCKCGICQKAGIEVVIFRGSERNKRRGFHNLAVFRKKLNRIF
tara:strand:+ start:1751 stop:3004 length:1254 start_codon:yes stop_codon:yes gene_type:complete